MSHFEQDLADVERALLRSARLDERAVSREAHQRILAGLGITGVLSSVSSVASGTVVATAASSVTRATLVVVLKWAAIGATAGGLALGAAPHLERALSSKATPAATIAAPHEAPPPFPAIAARLAPPPENLPVETRPLSSNSRDAARAEPCFTRGARSTERARGRSTKSGSDTKALGVRRFERGPHFAGGTSIGISPRAFVAGSNVPSRAGALEVGQPTRRGRLGAPLPGVVS